VKSPVKKAVAKKAPVKKAPVKKAPVKKAPVKKAPVKKAPVKKAVAKKVVASSTPAKKAPAKSVPAKAPVEVPVVPVASVPAPVAVAEERRLVMPPPPRHVKSSKKVAPLKPIKVAPAPATVSENEGPFTASEFKAMRTELAKELVRLQGELAAVEIEMDGLIRESGEGAGDDQADAGTKTFEREHEMSLVINARDMVLQTERALERIDAKTYGQCEECGNPIGKARLQVFPRATLCMVCKQKEERR
jgi:RNA polymerase-binding transcription factor DksA